MAVGAVLSQRSKDGEEHPIAYFSRKLLPREERYSTVEKECLAIKLGVISKVNQQSGAVRICVDLRPLNKSVQREVHPLPKVDETLAQLKGASLFSKLDANSDFWQIPLEEQSRLLTTFITPVSYTHLTLPTTPYV